MDIMFLIFIVAIGLLIVSVIYHALPYKKLNAKKPYFVLFPKYKFELTNIEQTILALEKEGFKKYQDTNIYNRGSFLGDIHISLMKLRVIIHKDKKYAELKSPLIAILFDTGDLWVLSNKIKGEN